LSLASKLDDASLERKGYWARDFKKDNETKESELLQLKTQEICQQYVQRINFIVLKIINGYN
jgi:hypothetical protein